MKKAYRYRGFAIVVKSTLLTIRRDGQHPNVRLGYLAVVRLDALCTPGFSTSCFETGTASGRLFQRETEVFAGGYKMATQIIDDALGPPVARTRSRRQHADGVSVSIAA